MAEKLKVKVIELEGVKLTPGAKYIFLLDPAYDNEWLKFISGKLQGLIGDNFTLLPIPADKLKVFEVMSDKKGNLND